METHLARTLEWLKTINESILSPLAPWLGGADGGAAAPTTNSGGGGAVNYQSMVGGMNDSYRSGIQTVHTSYGNISLQTLSLGFRGEDLILVDILNHFILIEFIRLATEKTLSLG